MAHMLPCCVDENNLRAFLKKKLEIGVLMAYTTA